MAKQKKQHGAKSAAIREYMQANPAAKVSDVVKALGDKGVKVLANQVYLIKSKGQRKAGKARRAAHKAAGQRMVASHAEAVLAVRQIAEQVGGMENLKALVDVLTV